MAKLDIDLLRDLQAAGFPEKQADTLIRGMTDKTAGQLDTKADLAELDLKMEKRFADLDTRMLAMVSWILKWVAVIAVTANLAMVGAIALKFAFNKSTL